MLDLAPIKTRLAAATPGEWRESTYYLGGVVIRSKYGEERSLLGTRCGTVPVVKEPGDATFIARSKADVEALVAEVERLRSRLSMASAKPVREQVQIADELEGVADHARVLAERLAELNKKGRPP